VSDNPAMQSIFPLVLYGSIALFVVVGVISMLTRNNNLYDQIGQGGMSMGDDRTLGAAPPPLDQQASRAEREQEIRQMLQARSDRLVRQGHEPLDIEAELAKLEPAGPGAHDPGLTAEVRQLVLARNERRQRQGQDPLDAERR
jgi:hypothetical protein